MAYQQKDPKCFTPERQLPYFSTPYRQNTDLYQDVFGTADANNERVLTETYILVANWRTDNYGEASICPCVHACAHQTSLCHDD